MFLIQNKLKLWNRRMQCSLRFKPSLQRVSGANLSRLFSVDHDHLETLLGRVRSILRGLPADMKLGRPSRVKDSIGDYDNCDHGNLMV